MRARSIKPGIVDNEVLAACGGDTLRPWARLLFALLPMLADRLGRLEDRPKRIAAQLFPYDDEMSGDVVGQLLDGLMSNGFLQRYMVDGNGFIQIVNFTKHQKPHQHEADSVIPPYEAHSIIVTTTDTPKNTQEIHQGISTAALTPSSLTPDSPFSDSGRTSGARARDDSEEAPVGKAMAEAAEVERRITRYMQAESDDDDRQVLRRVLSYLICDRISGKPLAHHKRIRFLDDLVRFPPGVVFIACHTFVEEKYIDTGKDPTYFIAICEKSATSQYLEIMSERRKEEDHVDKKAKQGPRRIGDILASANAETPA